jgi:hypothetical protein
VGPSLNEQLEEIFSEQRPERFNRIVMDVAAQPFVLGVADGLMLDVAIEIVVIPILIGHYQRDFLIHYLARESG